MTRTNALRIAATAMAVAVSCLGCSNTDESHRPSTDSTAATTTATTTPSGPLLIAQPVGDRWRSPVADFVGRPQRFRSDHWPDIRHQLQRLDIGRQQGIEPAEMLGQVACRRFAAVRGLGLDPGLLVHVRTLARGRERAQEIGSSAVVSLTRAQSAASRPPRRAPARPASTTSERSIRPARRWRTARSARHRSPRRAA